MELLQLSVNVAEIQVVKFGHHEHPLPYFGTSWVQDTGRGSESFVLAEVGALQPE